MASGLGSNDRRTIGGYEVLSLIGRGGMATVHLARRPGETELVAIKTVHADGPDDEAASTTLHDEARVLAHVRHANVVPLLEVLRVDDRVILVMPYVRGSSLAELMIATSQAEKSLPPSVVSAIAQDVLAGLHAAHTALGADGSHLRVVHRDVSPQNVMVGQDGVAKVLDFGIAKADGRAAKTTRDGVTKGKVAYMAPEQIHGEEADLRADLYAVGVVVWELLALDRLFAGANDADTLRRVLISPVPKLSTLRADIPDALDEWIAKAVARQRGNRFSSAAEMGAALAAAVPRASAAEVRQAMDVCAERIARREPQLSPTPAATVSSGASNYPPARTVPPRPRPRWRLSLGLSVVALSAIGAFAAYSVTRRHLSPASSVAPPAASASIDRNPGSDVAEPFEVPQTAPLPVPSVTSSGRPRATKIAPTSLPPNCAVPYTLDQDGRKKYRAECLP